MTCSIPHLIKLLCEREKTWDAIYQNSYDGDSETFTTCRSASHVPRNGCGEEKETPVWPPPAQ